MSSAEAALFLFLCNVPPYVSPTKTQSVRSTNTEDVPLLFVSGNWYDDAKAEAVALWSKAHAQSKILLTGGIGRLTLPQIAQVGGEPIGLRETLIHKYNVDPQQILLYSGSSVTTHNVRALIFYLEQRQDMSLPPCDIVIIDEGFLLRRLRATVIGELQKAKRSNRLHGVGKISFQCGTQCNYDELVLRHHHPDAARFLCVGEYDRLLKYSWDDITSNDAADTKLTAADTCITNTTPQLFSRSVAMSKIVESNLNPSSDEEIGVAVEQIRKTLSLSSLRDMAPGPTLREQLCPRLSSSNATPPPSLPPRRISCNKQDVKTSPAVPPRKSTLTPLKTDGIERIDLTDRAKVAPIASTTTTLPSPSHRQSFALVGDVSEAFQFMEDSPMFRARLAGFEARAKTLWSELTSVIKTTDQYLKIGRKFEDSTALLARDFQLYGTSSSSKSTANPSSDKDDNGLAPILHGLGSTLHEVVAGQQTLLATLEHAFINRMQEFVTNETTHARELTKRFNKASDAYESALQRSHVVKIDQVHQPMCQHRDKEVEESFERFELLRFELVRYYNQLERRKNFELIEGVCALLYSYKAYFGSSGHSILSLVPQMLQLQQKIQGEREGYAFSDTLWDRRQKRLAESLVSDGETLAKRFVQGNDEYPLENFEKSGASSLRVGDASRNGQPIEQMGFLLKMSTSVRKDWKRRWFLLQGGNLYYVRGWKDTLPTLVCEVLLCTVRACTGPKAVRFSFELISPNRRTFTLQASNQRDMDAWMHSIQRTMEHLLVGGGSSGSNGNSNLGASSVSTSSAMSPSGTTVTSSTHKRSAVSAILSSNPICADCDATHPEWVSINIGALICLRCSGIHRSLGVHISKMRSMTLDRLPDDVLSMLNQLGNNATNNIFEADLHVMSGWERPTLKNTNVEDLKRFIRAKYEHRGFVDQLKKDDGTEGGSGSGSESESESESECKSERGGVSSWSESKSGEVLNLLERLISAGRDNNVADILYCLAHGANVNEIGMDGGTVLHVACEMGSLESLTLTILNGGKLDTMNAEGLSPLDVAMIKGQTEAMEICLSRMQTPSRALPKPNK